MRCFFAALHILLAMWSMETRKMDARMTSAPSHWFQLGMAPGSSQICTKKLKTMLIDLVMVTREGVSRLMAASKKKKKTRTS